MEPKRSYSMGARAQSAAATRVRILEAATALLRVRLRTDIRIEDVARDAGVSEMTVLRAFGSKFNLLQAALDHAREGIVAQRDAAEPGDLAGSVAAIFEHYELLGDLVIGNLALESSDASIRQMIRIGRKDHKAWVERQFGPQLAGRAASDREILVDALVVACDVYVWKRLRRDMGLSRRRSVEIVLRMVRGLVGADSAEPV